MSDPEGKKVDLLSAKLGFEALVRRIRELESGVKDVSFNSRKRIGALEARIAELEEENALTVKECDQHAKDFHEETDRLKAENQRLRDRLHEQEG